MGNSSSQRWKISLTSKQRSQAVWSEFLELFIRALESKPPCQFAWAWKSAKNRTSFYRNGVLPEVAKGLGLVDAYELFRVDSTFCVQSASPKASLVPIIHVESENQAASAEHEVRKLCALTSRLKVLISCDEWSDSWNHGGHAQRYLSDWRQLVRNHNSFHPDDCEMGVIVAECRDDRTPDEEIYFYATVITDPIPVTPVQGELIFRIKTAGIEPCDPGYAPSERPGSPFDLKPGITDERGMHGNTANSFP
jgi:hypothetical protein